MRNPPFSYEIWRETRRRSVATGLAVALSLASSGCDTGSAPKSMPPSSAGAAMGESAKDKCAKANGYLRPLVVDWPATDRAALESDMQQGLVVLRYQGCQLEVLSQCRADGTYGYSGITRKNDVIKIRSEQDLYAKLPLGAADLEGRLARSGELTVEQTIVGTYETTRNQVGTADLEGACDGATHIMAGLTTGAFRFFAGRELEAGAEASIKGGAGAGANHEASREVLSSDGDTAACKAAAGGDEEPPDNCGALIRINLLPLSDVDATAWTGPAETGSATPTDDRTVKPLLISGGIAMGLGAGALGVMGWAMADGKQKNEDGHEQVGADNPAEAGALSDTTNAGMRANTIAWATGIAGGALLVAGAVMLGLGLHRKKMSEQVSFTGNGLLVKF